MLEGGVGFNSDLFGVARTLVRAAEERAKPNAERLREFGEAGLASMEQQLFSKVPFSDDYEITKLTDALTFLAGQLGIE